MSRSPALNASAMTPPRLAGQAGKAMRPFSANTKYPIKLAERLRSDAGTNSIKYTNMHIVVDPSIKIPGNATDAVINSDSSGSKSVELTVNNGSGSKQLYKGVINSTDPQYSLTFDATSQTLVLDRVDASVSFATSRPASSGSDMSASDNDSVGTPDADNPYDWRHQLKRTSHSPDDAMSVASGVDSYVGSPAPHLQRTRKASTPPGSVRGGSNMQRAGSQTSFMSTPARESDGEIDFDADDDNNNKNNKNQARERDDGDGDNDDDDDDDGGFTLVLEKPNQKRGRKAFNPGTDRPKSLAEIAESRSGSRQPMASRVGHDDAGGGGLEIEFDQSPPPRSHKSFDDQDVSDMEVGPPVRHVRSPSLEEAPLPSPSPPPPAPAEPEPDPEPAARQQQQQEPPAADAAAATTTTTAAEDADDMVEAFEQAFEQDEYDPYQSEEEEVSEAE